MDQPAIANIGTQRLPRKDSPENLCINKEASCTCKELEKLNLELQRQNEELLAVREEESQILGNVTTMREDISKLYLTVNKPERLNKSLLATSNSEQSESAKSKMIESSLQRIETLKMGEELFRSFPNYARMTAPTLQRIPLKYNINNDTHLAKGNKNKEDLVAMLTLV